MHLCTCASSMIDAMTNMQHFPHPAAAHRRNVLGYVTPARDALACAADRLDSADGGMDWLEALAHVALAQVRLEHATAQLVRAALDNGAAWSQIGARLGVSRQAAHQRFGHLVPAPVRQVIPSPMPVVWSVED